jgi:hypothetical protein
VICVVTLGRVLATGRNLVHEIEFGPVADGSGALGGKCKRGRIGPTGSRHETLGIALGPKPFTRKAAEGWLFGRPTNSLERLCKF